MQLYVDMTEREPYPSEKQDRFIVRLPDGMRDQIKASAAKGNRSMNAEIVHALEFYFAFDDLDPSRNPSLLRELEGPEARPLSASRKQDLIRATLADLERQLIATLQDE